MLRRIIGQCAIGLGAAIMIGGCAVQRDQATCSTLKDRRVRSVLVGGTRDAVASGERTLFLIKASGVFQLTRDLQGVRGKGGIEIAASHVTLDLNGHSLVGAVGSGDGILVGEPCRDVRITNGSIHDWGRSGVAAGWSHGSLFESLLVGNNGMDGINAGIGSAVRACTASDNARGGIRVDSGGLIEGCIAVRNGRSESGGAGLDAGDASLVTGCVAFANGHTGIYLGAGGIVRTCTAKANRGHGIEAESHSTIADCTVSRNSQDGIHVGAACRVRGCTVSLNEGDGIEASSASFVAGNGCTMNGSETATGAGIRVTGFNNFIEHNHAVMNGHGLVVLRDGNVIGGNFVHDNGRDGPSDYVIAPGNVVERAHELPDAEAVPADAH